MTLGWNPSGPTTSRQILEGKHMKRVLNAHLTTLQVLFDLQMEKLLELNPDLSSELLQLVDNSCILTDSDDQEIKKHLEIKRF